MSNTRLNKPDDTEKLLEQYCVTRDKELRNILHNRYSYIAGAVARRYTGRGIEYDDLFQVASLALVKALERFDITKGVKLQSFVVPTIMGEIKNYFRNYSQGIKTSRKSNDLIMKMKTAREDLTRKLNRTPKTSEIAEYMQVSEETVLELLEINNNTHLAYLDSETKEGSGSELLYLLGRDDEGYSSVEDRDFIKSAMKLLDKKERYIIYQRYFNQKSQREVSKAIGVSQMYVSRAEKKILDKMRTIIK